MNKRTKRILGWLCVTPVVIATVYIFVMMTVSLWREHGIEFVGVLAGGIALIGLLVYGLFLLEESE